MKRRTLLGGFAASALAAPFIGAARAQTLTLNGAVRFNDDHAFNKALLRFEELARSISPGSFRDC